MSFIPEDASWYLAELVQRITVQDDPKSIIHTNMVLVNARSPDEAFEKANKLGQQSDIEYSNPEDKLVVFTYLGLHDLNVICGELEHGTELIYSEDVDMSGEQLSQWISTKEDLGVFSEPSLRLGERPDYSSGDIVKELHLITGERS